MKGVKVYQKTVGKETGSRREGMEENKTDSGDEKFNHDDKHMHRDRNKRGQGGRESPTQRKGKKRNQKGYLERKEQQLD
jgi:hypothetical protein